MAVRFVLPLFEFAETGNTVLWTTVLLCPILFFILRRKKVTNIPGPAGLPFLGYLPFLGNDPHLTLFKLSEKYGSIFGLYMGNKYVVVVTDFNAAKELYNKETVLNRNPNAFSLLPDGVGFASLNGQVWMEQRRYTMTEMKHLGFSGSSWEQSIQCEVEEILDLLKQPNGKPTDFNKPLSASLSNNVLALVSGDRLPMGDPGREILDEGVAAFETMHDQSSIVNFSPSLFKIAVKLGLLKIGDKLEAMERMNEFVKHTIEECRRDGRSCFINNYLREIEKRKDAVPESSFSVKELLGTVQVLLIAGSNISKISLTWLFLAMATYLDIQDKVQEELDRVLSEEEIPCWEDRGKLPYCQAALLEGQRWRTLVPLNLLHRTSEDTDIRGFVIPKETDVIAMIWAFHNDTKYWKDPGKFSPERFLTEDGKRIKKLESYAPFSVGKRVCPRNNEAYIEIFIYFTSIMHTFRILPAEDASLELKPALGVTPQPKHQLLRFVPRK